MNKAGRTACGPWSYRYALACFQPRSYGLLFRCRFGFSWSVVSALLVALGTVITPLSAFGYPSGCRPLGTADCTGPMIDPWYYQTDPTANHSSYIPSEEAALENVVTAIKAGSCKPEGVIPRTYPPFVWPTEPHTCTWGGPRYDDFGFGLEQSWKR